MESYASSSSRNSNSTGEIEMDSAVTSAVALAASFLQHVANPPRPVYQRDYTPGYVESERERISMEERIANFNFMRNKEAHYALTADLVEHWIARKRIEERFSKEVQEIMKFDKGSGLVMENVESEVEKMIQGEGSSKMKTQLVDGSKIKCSSFWKSADVEPEYFRREIRWSLYVWNNNVFSKLSVIKSRYFMVIKGIIRGLNQMVNVVNAYGPRSVSVRRALWSELAGVMEGSQGAGILIGHFNMVRVQEERLNSIFDRVCATALNDFIYEACLYEFALRGQKYFYVQGKKSKENEEYDKALNDLIDLEGILEVRSLKEDEEWIRSECIKSLSEIERTKTGDLFQKSRSK
ncbi:hypothetical protein QVD17_34739 [Tagetes erecta]|uniref:Uncharacterized protein n=1 Tax=Tagetes erecta TaxID=13708 RepID=A0AAD8JY63_TARER|nr:hypothetical protein QVD17_34739 [Tagetes erecta]